MLRQLQSRTWESITGPRSVYEIQENDGTSRNANFQLFYRPLEAAPGISAQPFTHWAVVVEYGDHPTKVFTFEAGAEEKHASKIAATRSTQYPDYQNQGTFVKLGSQCISPKRLLELAQRVSLNNKPYNLLIRNCQSWCKEFCGLISPDFMKDLFWDSSNTLAVAGGILAVLGGAIYLASKSEEKDEDEYN